MPVALLIPGLVFFGALVLLGLTQTTNVWSASQTDANASFWNTILGVLTGKVQRQAISNAVRTRISHWALAQLAPVSRWLTALNSVLVGRELALAGFAERVEAAIARLVTVVIPREAGRATHKVGQAAKAAHRAADQAAARAHAAGQAVEHLGAQVRPKVAHAAHAIAVTIPNDLAGLRGRIKTVERDLTRPGSRLLKRWAGLLWAAGLAGLFVRALARRFPWLFCRKVKSVGNRVCALDDSLLTSLLQDTLVVAGTLSLVEFAQELQPVTAEAVKAIQTFWRAAP